MGYASLIPKQDTYSIVAQSNGACSIASEWYETMYDGSH